jgi:thiamine transport system substrate-binding protein
MKTLALALCLVLAAGACADDAGSPETVTLLAHDFFAVSDDVLEEFTRTTGYEVEIILGGDAGLMVNQAILSAGNPVADVMFGIDTTFLTRAFDAELFEPYESPRLGRVLPEVRVDPAHRVTPIDFGDVCVNYDLATVGDPPETLLDLTDERFAGELVVQDPAVSSPGLAFLMATVATFGEEGDYTWRDYWADLRENDVRIAPDWGTAYYGDFSGASDGDRSLVVSYASSPPAEVLALGGGEAPTAILTEGCFRQVEYAGILRGASETDGARRLIDFLLSRTFQEDVPLNMYVFPVHRDAALPPVFAEHAVIPSDPVLLDPDTIAENRERWVDEWESIVLR